VSLLAELLRANDITNEWDLLKRFGESGMDVFVLYVRPDSRSTMAQVTKVVSPSHSTDPHAHWYDNGCKTFTGPMRESMKTATEWASQRYGITDWVRSPFFSSAMVPGYVLDKAKTFLKESKVAGHAR